MKRNFLIFVTALAVLAGLCSCDYPHDTDENIEVNQNISDEENVTDTQETTDEENVTDTQETSDETIETDVQTPSQAPAVGGSDYSFLRKYIDEVYNVQIASETVGKEARDEWVNNVFLKKSAEEQEALPPIYQMIVELAIPKDELIKKNNQYDEPYLLDSTIDALYEKDIETVKKLLMSPLALYYNGEIYTFDGILGGDDVSAIPTETLEEFFDRITLYCEQNKLLKYEWENIDKARRMCGLDVVNYFE